MNEQTEEQEKMDWIYRKYYRLMLKEAYKILNNSNDAEDAVQQGFLKMLRDPSHIKTDNEPRLRAYVVKTAQNSAIDLWRKRNKQWELQLQGCSSFLYLFAEHCPSNIEENLQQLPEKHRRVLLLKYHMGYSAEEAARILHTSKENIYKTDQRARKALESLCRQWHVL